jgi:hypothetical protein
MAGELNKKVYAYLSPLLAFLTLPSNLRQTAFWICPDSPLPPLVQQQKADDERHGQEIVLHRDRGSPKERTAIWGCRGR